jgi:hypothetical protein
LVHHFPVFQSRGIQVFVEAVSTDGLDIRLGMMAALASNPSVTKRIDSKEEIKRILTEVLRKNISMFLIKKIAFSIMCQC